MKPDRGFTLIELMIVLLIIATLSSLVAPSIAVAFRRGGLSATGRQLCEMLNFSYMSAVVQHRPVVVNLDAARRRCWVTMARPALPWLEQERADAPLPPLAALALPEGTQVNVTLGDSAPAAAPAQGWDTVTFRGDGTSDDLLIELSNAKGERFEIQVHGVTGVVEGREVIS